MNKFTQKAFLQFFFPSTLVGFGLALSNVIDSVVVGNSLGEAGLAAIGYSIPIYMLIDVIYVGLSIGGSVQFTKLLGNSDKKSADKIASIIIEISIILGTLIGVLGYLFTPLIAQILGAGKDSALVYSLTVDYCKILFITVPFFFTNSALYYLIRSDDQEKFAGISFFIGTMTDVVLNVVLVTLLNIGIVGSAYATLAGQIISVVILLMHLMHKERNISFKPVALDFKEIATCFKIGFASSNQYISKFIFTFFVNHILTRLAGDSGVAVFDVVLNLSYLAFIFMSAASDSLVPLASTLYGERNFPELHKMLNFSTIVGFSISVVYIGLLALAANPLCYLFGLDNAVTISIGIVAIRLYCLSAVFECLSIITEGYYQATDRELATFIISIFRGVIFLIGFAVIFSFTNEYIFWVCYPVTQFCGLIVVQTIRVLPKFSSKKIVSADRFYTTKFNYDMDNLSSVIDDLEEMCENFELPIKKSMYISNALEEVCVAIRDNTKKESAADFYIIVTVVFEQDGNVRFCIRDNSTEFNPFDQKTNKINADNLDDMDVLSGLGIMMVKKKAKEFNYRRYLNFNTLIITI